MRHAVLKLLYRSFSLTSLFVVCSGVVGCSFLFGEDEREHTIERVDVTLIRGSLTGEEFENYTVSQGRLFRECGTVRSGRSYPSYQNVSPLKRDFVLPFLESADELVTELEDDPKWADPGSLRGGLSDPGIVRAQIRANGRVYSVETSVDGIANPSSAAEKRLKKTIEVIRGASEELCRNKTFYGIQFYRP